MDSFATFPDPQTVRFARTLGGPGERVWDYLTQAEKVSTWLADADLDPCLGGLVELRMQPKVDGQRLEECPIIQGTIIAFEPRRRLTYTWRNLGPGSAGANEPESELRFELQPQGDDTQLVLEHTRLAPGWLASVAGGWHYLLDELERRLVGHESTPFMETYQAVSPEYEKRAAAI